MYKEVSNNNMAGLQQNKLLGKTNLFEVVADQTGEIYNEKVLTIFYQK